VTPAGATSSSHTIPSASSGNAGSYSVVVSDMFGTATTNPVDLTFPSLDTPTMPHWGVIVMAALLIWAATRRRATWLFCAAVLSFRAPLMRKLPGLLAGTVLLQILNLVRIVTLYWIGLYSPDIFEAAHMEIWPTVFIIVAIVLFIGWIEWSRKGASAHVVA
jgi:exosortase/archaeosortase family protein